MSKCGKDHPGLCTSDVMHILGQTTIQLAQGQQNMMREMAGEDMGQHRSYQQEGALCLVASLGIALHTEELFDSLLDAVRQWGREHIDQIQQVKEVVEAVREQQQPAPGLRTTAIH